MVTTKFVYDRRKTASKDRKGTLEIRVYNDGQKKFVNTGVKLYPEQWKKERICNHPQAAELNESINLLLSRIQEIINDMEKNHINFSFDRLFVQLDDNDKGDSFLSFMKKGILNDDICEDTRKHSISIFKALEDFKFIRSFSDITQANIAKWDMYAKKRCNSINTVANYHKVLKKWVRQAFVLELIKKNPYDNFKFKRYNSTNRKYLTKDELSKIESFIPPTAILKNVKDMFIFCCYTGLAYSDMSKFNWNKVTFSNGMYRLIDKRKKTEEEFNISLMDKAYNILKEHNFVIPKLTNQKYNEYLKVLAEFCSIKKNITTHVARHTFATTIALNNGVPIETLAKMMGHSNIKTTQIYAKIMPTTVDNAFNNLNKVV